MQCQHNLFHHHGRVKLSQPFRRSWSTHNPSDAPGSLSLLISDTYDPSTPAVRTGALLHSRCTAAQFPQPLRVVSRPFRRSCHLVPGFPVNLSGMNLLLSLFFDLALHQLPNVFCRLYVPFPSPCQHQALLKEDLRCSWFCYNIKP